VLVNDPRFPAFWANGAVGTVADPPFQVVTIAEGWAGNVRMVRTVRGLEPYHWVVLDEPRVDGDGDGPYKEAELAAAWLHPTN
jgi:hypothetical protein